MKHDLSIGLLQLDSKWESPHYNLDQLKDFLLTKSSPPDILVLPEMWLTGFVMDPKMHALSIDDPIISAIQNLSYQYGIHIVGSHSLSLPDDIYANRALLHSPRTGVRSYDKQYLFTPSGEHVAYTKGNLCPTFDIEGWKVKLQICYDLRFPESVRDQEEVDLIIYMANWPAPRIHHWTKLLQARAIENQCYVAACNRIGKDGNGWDFPGGSIIVNYQGEITLDLQENKYQKALINFERLHSYRQKLPFYKDKKVINLKK